MNNQEINKQIADALYVAEKNPQIHHKWLAHQQKRIEDQADQLNLAVKALEEIKNVYNDGVASREANIANNTLEEIKRRNHANKPNG